MTTKEAVMVQLDEVEDPELDLSIVELGLVYDVRFEEKDEGLHAEVALTLTSPGCPAALQTEGLASVHINLVWKPRWDPKVHASEDARMDMGIWD